MKPRDLLRYRKDPRVIITIPLLILAATSLVYYVMQRAKDLSPEALNSQVLLFVLWNINVLLILGILFVLLRGIVKLVLERHAGIDLGLGGLRAGGEDVENQFGAIQHLFAGKAGRFEMLVDQLFQFANLAG